MGLAGGCRIPLHPSWPASSHSNLITWGTQALIDCCPYCSDAAWGCEGLQVPVIPMTLLGGEDEDDNPDLLSAWLKPTDGGGCPRMQCRAVQ